MSLHQLAHHVQSAGRGDDKVLVHMTPGEVGGLQALAMAHGGSLTINPETGLPEAGFLKSLLPTIAGIGLSMIPGVGPLMAAGIVGGGTALATGNLGKGLMAGLGAYGGAGLAQGLMGVGTAGAAKSMGTTAVEAAKTTGGAGGAPIWSQATSGATTLPSWSTAANTAAVPSQLDKLAAGAKTLGQPGGFGNLYSALPTGTLPSLGIAALAGMSDQKGITPKKPDALIRPYTYERTQRPEAYDTGAPIYSATPGSSAERLYFNDQYTAQTPYLAPGPEYPSAADGGLVALAVGGPVEQMAAMNAVGANTGYPMAGINTPLYANPMIQRPEAVNVIAPSGDAGVTAYSGEPKFASGGFTAEPQTTGSYQYSYDPRTMQFTQTSAPKIKPNPIMHSMNLIGRAIGSGVIPTPTLDTGAKVSGGIAPPFGAITMSGPFGNVPMPIGMLSTEQRLRMLEQNQSAAPTPAAQPIVTGGIAQPAVQPAQPAQPAYTPPSIPAYQTPEEQLGLNAFYGMMNKSLGEMGGYAGGGEVYNLGGYSDGGRLLKGPGDGVSDSIPAVIGQRQPARLADGEFVVPARIVSELGNGSTEAGARKLYAMMDRVQNARRKSMGKKKIAVDSRAEKLLPA